MYREKPFGRIKIQTITIARVCIDASQHLEARIFEDPNRSLARSQKKSSSRWIPCYFIDFRVVFNLFCCFPCSRINEAD